MAAYCYFKALHMKRLAFSILLVGAIYLLNSFQNTSQNKAVQIIHNEWVKEVQNFNQAVIILTQQVEEKTVQPNDFIALKLQYKRIETLTAYFFPTLDKSLNGAPLNTVFTDVIISDVETPTGLQVLEEALFAENHVQDSLALLELKFLHKKSIYLKNRIQNLQIEDRQIFESARQEILRIETMGITGFDSPVFGNSLPGVTPALTQIEFQLRPYYDFANQHNSKAPKLLEQLFLGAQGYLKQNSNFESFDRAFFIRTYMDPLYGEILQLHLDCQIETIDLVSSIPQKLNYFATQLFAEDLLNPYAYSKIGKETSNGSLAEIGEKLFFDPILSANNQRACASCHLPEKAFTDGYKTSKNFNDDGFVSRNSPTIINTATQDAFFWDGRSGNINDQIDHVALNPDEFNSSVAEVVLKIRTSPKYLELYSQAYHRTVKPEEFGIADIKSALSQYIKTLTSYHSEFDQYMRKETDSIDQHVINGFNLFMGKATCATCHFPPTFYGLVPPLFEDSEFEVIGVPATSENKSWDQDMGRYNIFNLNFYKGSFKTPTIRNVAYTAPYMHNGVYDDLDEVVEFYNNGGGTGLGFNIPHQTLPGDSLHLTDQEQSDLVLFMESLSDTATLNHRPQSIPEFTNASLNTRPIGGIY